MAKLLHVSASPHLRSPLSSAKMMREVIIALMPATLFGIYWFKTEALIVILTCVISCGLFEYLFEKGIKRAITIKDGSAIVTGLLLALNLPSSVPLYIPIVGSFFAIVVVKQLYGGLGQNIMNPALAARCFLLIAFAGRMTTYTLDGVSSATPLATLKTGADYDLMKLFIGNIGGCIGETSAVALLIGAAYLLIKKIISIRIPLAIIISFSLFVLCFSSRSMDFKYLAEQLCAGGFWLGTWFMATDYVTSPINAKGSIIYGIIIGLLIGLFRIIGSTAEGVSFAIIFTNLLVPLIEKYTLPKAFGSKGATHEKK